MKKKTKLIAAMLTMVMTMSVFSSASFAGTDTEIKSVESTEDEVFKVQPYDASLPYEHSYYECYRVAFELETGIRPDKCYLVTEDVTGDADLAGDKILNDSISSNYSYSKIGQLDYNSLKYPIVKNGFYKIAVLIDGEWHYSEPFFIGEKELSFDGFERTLAIAYYPKKCIDENIYAYMPYYLTSEKRGYKFEKVGGPEWLKVTEDGKITGTAPETVNTKSEFLAIKVTDKYNASTVIAINVYGLAKEPVDENDEVFKIQPYFTYYVKPRVKNEYELKYELAAGKTAEKAYLVLADINGTPNEDEERKIYENADNGTFYYIEKNEYDKTEDISYPKDYRPLNKRLYKLAVLIDGEWHYSNSFSIGYQLYSYVGYVVSVHSGRVGSKFEDDLSIKDYIGTGEIKYEKVSGPDWLSVAENGKISGVRPMKVSSETEYMYVKITDTYIHKSCDIFEISIDEIYPLCGDVNIDYKVDLTDAKLVLRMALGIEKVDKNNIMLFSAADCNEDRTIDLEDAKEALRMALGIKIEEDTV